MTQSKNYQSKDFKGNDLLNVGKVTLESDASGANEAVRKSQAEAIANTTTQGAIVNSLASPRPSTTLDTVQLQAQLNTKET